LKPIEGFLKILCATDFNIEIDITVWKDYYNKEEFDVVIKPKELTVVNIALEPAKQMPHPIIDVILKQGSGTITIISEKGNVQIKLEDNLYSIPITLHQLGAGLYSATVIHSNNENTIEFEITDGCILLFNVDTGKIESLE
jgi:hypothetical protein